MKTQQASNYLIDLGDRLYRTEDFRGEETMLGKVVSFIEEQDEAIDGAADDLSDSEREVNNMIDERDEAEEKLETALQKIDRLEDEIQALKDELDEKRES